MVNLAEECGVTSISLSNAQKLVAEYGKPDFVRLVRYPAQSGCGAVVVCWPGIVHVFTGFNWGYGGEGPTGLVDFAKLIGLVKLANIAVVSSLNGYPLRGEPVYTASSSVRGKWTEKCFCR